MANMLETMLTLAPLLAYTTTESAVKRTTTRAGEPVTGSALSRPYGSDPSRASRRRSSIAETRPAGEGEEEGKGEREERQPGLGRN